MRCVDILRVEEQSHGTYAVMLVDRKAFCFTLEPPDRLNKSRKSNIPPGQYTCVRYISALFGETFKVIEVPGRSGIIFHWGNFPENTEGCILLGESIGIINGQRAVMNSVTTFSKFMGIMDGSDSFLLTIREVY